MAMNVVSQKPLFIIIQILKKELKGLDFNNLNHILHYKLKEMDEENKDAIIESLKSRIKKLEEENKELK